MVYGMAELIDGIFALRPVTQHISLLPSIKRIQSFVRRLGGSRGERWGEGEGGRYLPHITCRECAGVPHLRVWSQGQFGLKSVTHFA